MALAGGVAGWELPYTGGAQSNQDWRAALRATRTWRVGSGHTLPTTKAAWFGGGWPGGVTPPSPFLPTYLT